MNWIYLSPHLDDAALSCGGLIWEQRQKGIEASIWTVCAGDPPSRNLSAFAESLHTRWDRGMQATTFRRSEDIASCAELGASHQHFSVPDCIYRIGKDGRIVLYPSEESLFGELHQDDAQLVESLSAEFAAKLPSDAVLVCPLALGSHVDHKLTRAAVERVVATQASKGIYHPTWYYADYPYAARIADELPNTLTDTWAGTSFPISEAGLVAWERSIAAHASQVSTFWSNQEKLRLDLRAYARTMDGVRLWKLSKLK